VYCHSETFLQRIGTLDQSRGTPDEYPALLEKCGRFHEDIDSSTTSETWAGHIHPAQALRQYRSEFVGDAKAVVVGMTSNGFTLADPNDRGMLDVVGFDTSAPAVIADFIRN
jgi:DNA repair exonuclease SbcCD nuclease subunit